MRGRIACEALRRNWALSKRNHRSDLIVFLRRSCVLEAQKPEIRLAVRFGQMLPELKNQLRSARTRAGAARKNRLRPQIQNLQIAVTAASRLLLSSPRFSSVLLGSSSLPRFSSVLLGSSSVLLGATGLFLLKNCFGRNLWTIGVFWSFGNLAFARQNVEFSNFCMQT